MDGLATPWSRLKQLPPDPCRRRTGRDVEMDQLTAVVTDEAEHLQDPGVNGVDHQEIGCPDALELVRQAGPPALAPGPRRLPPPVSRMERLLTTIPSLSSSPRMRSVPQSRFSWEIRAMRPLTSRLSRGRPRLVRDLQLQYSRQPLRCHRRTVSGWTTSRCWRQSFGQSRRTQDPKDSISISEARGGVGAQDDVKLMAKDEILQSGVTTRP